jgi:glycosyltransferase involved in cell wall biosynthesis
MKELVESVYCVPRSCIDYVPHWSTFEPDEIIPAEKTEMVKKLMLEKKFLVQYSGNMGLWHDIDSVVEAAADLKDHPDIHFIMIGDGMRRAHAQLRADQFQLQNMTWLPFQPRETLADSLSCCHIALISQREGLKGVAVPCKLYGILASGRGIVAMVPAQSEIDLVVHEEECGQTISPGDIGGLVSAILQLKGKPSLVARMGENAFRAYHQKYTLKTAITKFQNIWIKNLEYEEKASSFG